jgi:hypothetical protein
MNLFDKALEQLSIPKDFNNIHSVSDLIKIKNFGTDINTFFEKYLEEWYSSFKMNMDEVLDYIPENELQNYKFAPGYEFIFSDLYIFYVNNDYEDKFLKLDLNFTKSDIAESDRYVCYTYGLNPYTDSITNILNHVNSTDKVYFVDTKNKKIHVCLDDIKLLKCFFNKIHNKQSLQITYGINRNHINEFYTVNYKITLYFSIFQSGFPREYSETYDITHQFKIDNNTYESNNFLISLYNKNSILQEINSKWFINDTNTFNICKKPYK